MHSFQGHHVQLPPVDGIRKQDTVKIALVSSGGFEFVIGRLVGIPRRVPTSRCKYTRFPYCWTARALLKGPVV
ncbi:hypothetical protein R1flu_007680 [Riccia fluitans]|uniref:Uncharacterized protein n=1 Tax=Riccia fluitans TaxID=41844 RepID=A0ABD1Z034_9MARC